MTRCDFYSNNIWRVKVSVGHVAFLNFARPFTQNSPKKPLFFFQWGHRENQKKKTGPGPKIFGNKMGGELKKKNKTKKTRDIWGTFRPHI